MATFFIILGCSAQMQGTATLYGYKQGIAPGVQQNVAEEGTGKQVTSSSRGSYNYHIYISSPDIVYPAELWLNGERFSVRTRSISAPVTVTADDDQKVVTLVPATSEKVLQLTPAPPVDKELAFLKHVTKENELVVLYKMKGKLYYQRLKTFKKLPSVVLQ